MKARDVSGFTVSGVGVKHHKARERKRAKEPTSATKTRRPRVFTEGTRGRRVKVCQRPGAVERVDRQVVAVGVELVLPIARAALSRRKGERFNLLRWRRARRNASPLTECLVFGLLPQPLRVENRNFFAAEVDDAFVAQLAERAAHRLAVDAEHVGKVLVAGARHWPRAVLRQLQQQ